MELDKKMLVSNMVQAIVTLADKFQGGNWRLIQVTTVDEIALIKFGIDNVVITVEISSDASADDPIPSFAKLFQNAAFEFWQGGNYNYVTILGPLMAIHLEVC